MPKSLSRLFPAVRRVSGWRLLPLLVLTLATAGCAFSPDESDDSSQWSAEKLYTEAHEALDANDYETAIEHFETLEAKYPFGRYAEQAQLDTIYAYFRFDEADSAIAAADRFIKLHPRHAKVDYAYYMRGLASASKKDNPFDAILPQDSSVRDPSSTRKSYEYFAELVKKFPDSRYTGDAVQRMGHLLNSLAMHEIHVARYYVRRNAHVAAINRAKYVIENYPRTPAARLALEILADSYKQLDMDELARDAQRVLQLNVSQSEAVSPESDLPESE
jgi:outer membrane protein assembly factor BamD